MMKLTITRKTKELEPDIFFKLFDEFINDSFTGKRLKKDGTRLTEGSVTNYVCAKKSLLDFVETTSFQMKLFIVPNLTSRELDKAQKHWFKFYNLYVIFLQKQGMFDNYIGMLMKCIRCFLNYLNNDKRLMIGDFQKQFYCPKEEIAIITLSLGQLKYLIYNKGLNKKLDEPLRIVKDIFVFGCSVGLRVSDLLALNENNLKIINNKYYIQTKSRKTATYTSIMLPDYCIEIVKKYRKKYETLLPPISIGRLNIQLKKLGQYLPENYDLKKIREQNGKQKIIYKDKQKKENHTFADLITTHTMRRTAITSMLSLGMPENIVRKISGHAPNSKEFYRYVEYAQSTIDQETEKYFQKMKTIVP